VRPWQTLLADGVSRVASGGMALDPTVIAKLLGRRARADPMAKLTERQRSVLALMAEGLPNTAIAGRVFLSEGAINKYTTNIFTKLGIFVDDDTNRRVRAVLTFLDSVPQ
jgi:DNA-binding NarL/FixJ family response regulator